MAAERVVLVTGATGFVGQHLVRRLLAQSIQVIALDVAPNPALVAEWGDRVNFIQADLADGAGTQVLIAQYQPTQIAHLAFLLPPDAETNPLRALQINSQGFVHLLDAARANGTQRVVWTSSMSAYGPLAKYPVQPVDEDAPTFPTGMYGATKVLGEYLTQHYRKQFGLDVIGLRANLVYGPGKVRGLGEFKIWSRDLFETAVKGETVRVPFGDQSLDWLYVTDFARALDFALRAPPTAHHLFNLSGDWRPVRDAVNAVRAVYPDARIELDGGRLPAERQPPQLDARRARDELGFTPEFTVEKGARTYLDWLNEHAH